MAASAATPPTYRQYRRHRRLLLCSCCLLFLAIIAIVILVLMFVVFKIEDPTTEIVTANVTGLMPPVPTNLSDPPAEDYRLNLTMELSFLIRNPNRATFSHQSSRTALLYQAANVGGADVPSGSISSGGSELLQLKIKIDPDQLLDGTNKLLQDAKSGVVDFDAETILSGKMTVMGFIKVSSAPTSHCHIVVGFPELQVRSSVCTSKAKT